MIVLDGASLTLDALDRIAHDDEPVAPRRRRARARPAPRARSSTGTPPAARAVYGINTGFGALADVAIPARSALARSS